MKHDGVDDMHPPPTKLFDLTAANSSTDLATMAHHQAVATTASSASNILTSFDSLTELLCGPTNKTPGPAPTALAARVTTDYSDIPAMSPVAFYECYSCGQSKSSNVQTDFL